MMHQHLMNQFMAEPITQDVLHIVYIRKNGGLHNWGYPKNRWFRRKKNHLEMDENWGLRGTHFRFFRKPPNLLQETMFFPNEIWGYPVKISRKPIQ